MAKTAKDYFVIEHEAHIGPINVGQDIKHFRDNKRYKESLRMCSRITDPRGIARITPDPNWPKTQPELAIAMMDAAGIDMACLMPHKMMMISMNSQPEVSNGWMIDACEKYPDRLVMAPTLGPTKMGIKNAIWEMEYYAKEKGVKYFKLYPPDELCPMNDERLWPFYAKAQELGMVIGIHTGHGYIYPGITKNCLPLQLEDVCREFWDLRIIAFHFGWPWHLELNGLAGGYPNLYIGMSFLNKWALTRPRAFAELIGEAILYAGVDKVIWSNDGLATKPVVDAFASFQIPEDMQKDYAYEALTEKDKAKMFGLTMAKLVGIEPRKRVGTTKLP